MRVAPLVAFLTALLVAAAPAVADDLTLVPRPLVEWKAVYGRIEPRILAPARARIGGTIAELAVSEGDLVRAGQLVARVRDDKLGLQIEALDAELRALEAQLERAEADLERGRALVERGAATAQRLDQLNADVTVTRNRIMATRSQREVIVRQQAEGAVLAPADGRVLSVPVTQDSVILAGETVAGIGSGGFFLRLAIPERHAGSLREGAEIRISAAGRRAAGRLAKLYPQIENGRVIADVEVEGFDTAFVDARVPVEVPVGERSALVVPAAAVTTRWGLDFVTVRIDGQPVERTVVLGEPVEDGDGTLVEVLTGLAPGDTIVLP